MAARGGGDVRELLLQVDASVELARRNLGQLATQVQSDSARMDKSLASVDGAFNRLGGIAGKIGGVLSGIGLSIGVGTFVQLGRDALQFADDLSAAAEQAGINIERYQTLKGSLRALEVEGDKADKIFKVLMSTLGDVQNGADNGATQAIERLGIKSKILNGEIDTTDELLDALAAASQNAGSKAQFTSEMVDILGRKLGVELANAISDGGTALRQGEEDLRSYGTVLTEEMVDRLADANESIDATLEQASYHFAIFASDVIKEIKSVLAWYRQLSLAGQAFSLGAGMFNPGAALGVSIGQRIRPGTPARPSALAQAQANLRAAQRRVASGEDATAARDLRMAEQEVRRLASEAKRAEPDDGPAPKPPKPPRSGGGRKSRRSGGAKAKKPDLSRKSLSSLEEGLPAWARLDESVPNFIASLDVEKPLAELLRVNEATADLGGLIQSLPPLPDMSKMLTVEEQERIEGFLADFQHDLASGLADAIVNGEDLGDVLVNSLKRAAAAIIESGIIELLQELAGALGHGQDGERDLLASIVAGIGKRAAGGPVSARTPYLVGERGPELFVPKISGDIVANHALRGGGLQRVEVLVSASEDFQVKVAHTAGAVVRMAAPGIADRATSQVISAILRPQLPSGI